MNPSFISLFFTMTTELKTITDFIRYATSNFNRSNIYYGHGTSNPLDEAKQLILASLDLSLDSPPEFYNARLIQEEKEQLLENINLRINNRIPTAYIINRSWFCNHEFYVDERVLIPRSPIGELIQAKFKDLLPQAPKNILDLCTGSGCIGIACAYDFPEAEVDIADISPDALAVAEINIEGHQMQHRVFPICSDLFKDLPDIQYDLIVSNPPYVDQEDMLDLPLEYQVEPELALIAGHDGLELVERILREAHHHLSDNGILICEVGNSSVALIEKYPSIPFCWIEFEHGGSGVFTLTKTQLTMFGDGD